MLGSTSRVWILAAARMKSAFTDAPSIISARFQPRLPNCLAKALVFTIAISALSSITNSPAARLADKA